MTYEELRLAAEPTIGEYTNLLYKNLLATTKGGINMPDRYGYDWSHLLMDASNCTLTISNEPIGTISDDSKKKDAVVERVIFSPPATIVILSDGRKAVVKTQNGEKYDPEKGLAMCCLRLMSDNHGYHELLSMAHIYDCMANLNEYLDKKVEQEHMPIFTVQYQKKAKKNKDKWKYTIDFRTIPKEGK